MNFRSHIVPRNFIFIFLILVLTIVTIPRVSDASITDGTISSTDRYAWGENVGWIDFGSTYGDVHITNTELTGYAYGENIGWISLNCSNTSTCADNPYKVSNDGSGNLSGYAWSENVGWIDFGSSYGSAHISSTGVMSGNAYGENIGWIVFDTDHPVTTDWRYLSAQTNNGGGGNNVAPSQSSGAGFCGTSYIPSSFPSLQSTERYPTDPKDIAVPPKISPIGITSSALAQIVKTIASAPNLSMGKKSDAVKNLQKYLNVQGYIISKNGPGSIGNETTIFGSLTKNALIKFQKDHGIKPASGYFGPITKAFIKNQK